MLALNAVGYAVAGRTLFDHLNFSFSSKKYGLVGPNGVGKTTLARILSGGVAPGAGHVSGTRAAYFPQTEEPTDQLLSEYLIDVWESSPPDWVSAWLSRLDLSRNLKELSGGEWTKARLIRALAPEPEFLILDEPSNNLDRAGKESLLEFIRHFRGGLLIISHDREILRAVDVILEMSNRGLSVYGGDFDFYWDQRGLERTRLESELERSKRARRTAEREASEKEARQEKRVRRGKKKGLEGGIPRIILGGMKRRAQVTTGKIHKRESDAVNEAHAVVAKRLAELKTDPFLRLDFSAAAVPAGRHLVSASALNWRFTGSADSLWPVALDFLIKGPGRWHIRGANGSGKSTLLKMIAGRVTDGDRLGDLRVTAENVAYLDQRYGMLDPALSVLANVGRASRFSEEELRNELAFYGFTADKVFQPVDTLSGGELLKASLAHIFLGARLPDLILLDEPTNNLDLPGQQILENALRNYAGAMIVVSHDAAFVEALACDQTLSLLKVRATMPRP